MHGDDRAQSDRCVIYEMQRFVVIDFGAIKDGHASPL